MSYGHWTPNWQTWRNWETGNGRNWQTEAMRSTGNWQVRPAPVLNWQIGIPLPPPPPAVTWQTRVAPLGNWYAGPAPSWNRLNRVATMESWRTGDTDRIGNWQTELIPERNWYIRPNNNTLNWQTRRNRRAWNWQTRSLPWTNWQTEQDYSTLFPLYLALPPASEAIGAVQDPWRPLEERMPLLLTGNSQSPITTSSISPKCSLQEMQEFPDQEQIQMPAQQEQPRLTRGERKAALRKLKKKTYSPVPKRDSDNVGEDAHEKEKEKDQETGDNVGEDAHEKEKEKDQETETCTVCLEDFKPEEEVMVTPCNHMFHEDCIVPWVKSHAQCPICRLRFGRLPMNSNQP